MLVSIVSAPSRRRPVARQARRRRKCAETDLKRAAAGAQVIPRLRTIDTQSRPARHQRETALVYTSGRTGRRLCEELGALPARARNPHPKAMTLVMTMSNSQVFGSPMVLTGRKIVSPFGTASSTHSSDTAAATAGRHPGEAG